MIHGFVQARMTSRRFPGKVLAPLAGRPVIAHVLDRVADTLGREAVVLLTSDDETDAPLAAYVTTLGHPVFRGPLDDVVERFLLCLDEHPCDSFFRICGDSPLLDVGLLRRMMELADGSDADLITNLHPRTFAKGESVELVRAEAFRRLAALPLTDAEREHVTQGFYARDAEFSIVNVTAPDGAPRPDVALDDLDDLARLEELLGR